TGELLLEKCTLPRVGCIFLPRPEDRVVIVELRFEHAEPAEFRKQDASRLARWPHGILGVQLFPRFEISLRAGKIQIVEPAKSAVEPRRGQSGNRLGSRHQQHESSEEYDLEPSRTRAQPG